MVLARRTGLVGRIHGQDRHTRSKRGPSLSRLLDSLESRLLLSMNVTTISWGGVSQQAVANEYVMQTGLAVSSMALTLQGAQLHVDSATNIGYGYFKVVDSQDNVAYVQNWAVSHHGYYNYFAPNHPVYQRDLPSEANNQTLWSQQWQFQNVGQTINNQVGIQGADNDAVRAWGLTHGNKNLVVAIIDTGIDYNNPDLAANMWQNPGEIAGDGIDNDLDGVVDGVFGANFSGDGAIGDPLDDNGHGTTVAGLVGGVANNGGIVGVDWNVQLMAVKVLDGSGAGSDASILAGINYVTFMKTVRHVNIIAENLSLGRLFTGPTSGVGDPAVAAQFTAIQAAGKAGIITVGAADETGLDLDTLIGTTNDFPTAFTGPLFLSVAASDNRDNLASFSDSGGHVIDLAAPGVGIVGAGISGDGTSFAAPQVTGAIALLESLVPSATPDQVVAAILAGVDVTRGLTGHVISNGRLDIYKSAEILLGDQKAFGHVDGIVGGKVAGWIYDPNVGRDPVYGALYIDGKYVETFQANTARPDLNAALGSPNHGFAVTIPTLSVGPHNIQVFALDVTPDANGNTTRPVGVQANPHAPTVTNSIINFHLTQISSGSGTSSGSGGNSSGGGGGGGIVVSGNVPPIGSFDHVDPSTIVGWAFDAQAGALPVTVAVFMDGRFLTSGVADLNRPDLTKLGLGSINHGFSIPTPTGIPIGPHRISVYALDTTTGHPTFIGSRTLLENAPLAFFIDNVPGSSTYSGYVFDPEKPDQTVVMEIDVDGQQFAFFPTQASESRNDVPISNQNHGFNFTIPPLVLGAHFVQLIAYHPGTGIKTVIAARNILGNRLPTGSFAVNNNTVSGYVYDQDSPNSLHYRVDIDGKQGTVATGTQSVAQDAGPVIPIPAAPALPNIPGGEALDITQFGADGSLLHDTFALQTAIDDASALAGGGTVVIGAGTWAVNAITLRSNVAIDIEGTLEIAGKSQYANAATPLLHGTGIHNFSIFSIGGTGVIDGRESGVDSFGNTGTRPNILRLDGCDLISISNVEFLDAPDTSVSFGSAVINGVLTGTNHVTVNAVDFEYRQGTPPLNTTGMTPEGHDYLISNCTFSTGAEAIRAYSQDVETFNIVVDSATVNKSLGVGAGGNLTHGIDTFVVENSTFTQVSRAVKFFATRGNGSFVQNILIQNNEIDQTGIPFEITSVYDGGNTDPTAGLGGGLPNANLDPTTPLFQNILIQGNAGGQNTQIGYIVGLREQHVLGVSYVSNTVTVVGNGTLHTANLDGFYNDGSSGSIQTNTIDLPTDTFFYSIATPTLSPGTHTFNLFAVDPINGDNVLVKTFNLIVPALSFTDTQPSGAITSASSTVVKGYALDPNVNGPISVEVDVDGVSQGTFLANQFQANLPLQFGPNHGYSVPLTMSNGRHVISVFATDDQVPTEKVLISSSVVTAGPAPHGSLTLVRADKITADVVGFANYDPLTWQFRITIDGHTGNTLPVSTNGTFSGGVGHLVFKTPAVDPAVAHTVSLEYIDPVTLQPIVLATATLPAIPRLIGGLQFANNSVLMGFVLSQTLPNQPLTIFVSSDGLPIQFYTANLFVKGVGNHGFVISTQGVPAGTHTLRLYAVDPGTGLYIQIGQTVVTLPQP